VAELVDALGLGPSAFGVGVRVPSPVPLTFAELTAKGFQEWLILKIQSSFTKSQFFSGLRYRWLSETREWALTFDPSYIELVSTHSTNPALFGSVFAQSHDKGMCDVVPLKSNILFPKGRGGLPIG
jgi:hypothetical protein